jgi:5-methylcytosine-specific restriction endonuclease McrA
MRWFDEHQRRIAKRRAGLRCEYGWPVRCYQPAEEVDHFWPHIRGGATTLANAVAACQVHNQTKSGRWPSLLVRLVIAYRRRRYYPPKVRRLPGVMWRAGMNRYT